MNKINVSPDRSARQVLRDVDAAKAAAEAATKLTNEKALAKGVIDMIDRSTPGGFHPPTSPFRQMVATLIKVWVALMVLLLIAGVVISSARSETIETPSSIGVDL